MLEKDKKKKKEKKSVEENNNDKGPSSSYVAPTVFPYYYDIIKKPIVTEKTTKLNEENKITVEVKKDATKDIIKVAFEAIFKVKVAKVRSVNVRKKAKRVGKYSGFVGAYKKAIITLAPGYTVDLFGQKEE
jgi:large subunit ribosomal protein L23